MKEYEKKEDLMKELTDTLSALQTSVNTSEHYDNMITGEIVCTTFNDCVRVSL